MLKVELHTHTADDPVDYIVHTAQELIFRAGTLGYDAIAITLHNKQFDVGQLMDYATQQGVLLIPGVERSIHGKHVLLLNFSPRAERLSSFEELATLRQDEPAGVVIAPHPFFPAPSCLRGLMETHVALFDAVEVNAMYSRCVNFNRAAEDWARRHDKPMVGNGDVHRLEQLGTTYTLVDSERTPDAICAAIRQGRTRVESTPLALVRAVWVMAKILPSGVLGTLQRSRGSANRKS